MEHKINLFSITDHNRFNNELYEKIYEELEKEPYKNNLHLLHGVEFDVKLDPNMKAAHIVTIFDVKDKSDRFKIINALNNDKLLNKEESYCITRFEKILKDIGLNVLLIVHQKKSLENHNGKNASLSDTTREPFTVIKVGYVDALEYQKPNVEGILKSNLRNFDFVFPLITGSDCHEWECYPKHNRKKTTYVEHFTEIKALPTFKGLHLALSSPETRLNRFKNNKNSYIESLKINGKEIPLDPSLNVIIGENGSGKSTILEIINNNKMPIHVRKLKNENNISYKYDGLSNNLKYISQSEIIKKYNSDDLLNNDNTNFKDINHDQFELMFSTYFKELKTFIDNNIEAYSKFNSLQHTIFNFTEVFETGTYFVSLKKNENIIVNNHEERLQKLKSIINSIIVEYNNSYYTSSEKSILKSTLVQLRSLYVEIFTKFINKNIKISINNIVDASIDLYNTNTSSKQTTLDSKINKYNTDKNNIINNVIHTIDLKFKKNNLPQFPKEIVGESSSRRRGFKFNKEAIYNRRNLEEDFFTTLFNKDYRDFKFICSINNSKTFSDSVTGAREDNLSTIWNDNIQKFKNNMKKETRFILEESGDSQIGNTLGELSIAFYKYNLKEEDNIHIFIIDQPEDNISNFRELVVSIIMCKLL